MEDFDDLNTHHMPPADNVVRQFYEKIQEIPVKNWIGLENVNYRLTAMGQMQFTETGKFNDLPNLSFFNYCQAKNGGPIGKSSALTKCSHSCEGKGGHGGAADSLQLDLYLLRERQKVQNNRAATFDSQPSRAQQVGLHAIQLRRGPGACRPHGKRLDHRYLPFKD